MKKIMYFFLIGAWFELSNTCYTFYHNFNKQITSRFYIFCLKLNARLAFKRKYFLGSFC